MTTPVLRNQLGLFLWLKRRKETFLFSLDDFFVCVFHVEPVQIFQPLAWFLIKDRVSFLNQRVHEGTINGAL